jgi:ribokinase
MINFFNKKREIDLVGVGDLVVDTFIELNDAWIEDDNPAQSRELCMHFGDKLPYKKAVTIYGTGNSINAAHAAKKLGLSTAIITDTGNGELSKACLNQLKKNNIDTSYVTRHANQDTNHNFVLRFREDRTILVHHNEYNYSLPKNLKIIPKWIYLSSLSKNSLDYHQEIINYLNRNPQIKLAFQPGTFQIKLGYEKLKELYQKSNIFFCNKEEAQKILNTKEENISKLLEMLHELGPKMVVITDGPAGAYVFDGVKKFHGPMFPDIAPPVDRTGAGDAFSSTFTSAIILGKDIETALKWAPINSMSVVQYIGAQAGHLTISEIEGFLKNAPENYKAQIID